MYHWNLISLAALVSNFLEIILHCGWYIKKIIGWAVMSEYLQRHDRRVLFYQTQIWKSSPWDLFHLQSSLIIHFEFWIPQIISFGRDVTHIVECDETACTKIFQECRATKRPLWLHRYSNEPGHCRSITDFKSYSVKLREQHNKKNAGRMTPFISVQEGRAGPGLPEDCYKNVPTSEGCTDRCENAVRGMLSLKIRTGAVHGGRWSCQAKERIWKNL